MLGDVEKTEPNDFQSGLDHQYEIGGLGVNAALVPLVVRNSAGDRMQRALGDDFGDIRVGHKGQHFGGLPQDDVSVIRGFVEFASLPLDSLSE